MKSRCLRNASSSGKSFVARATEEGAYRSGCLLSRRYGSNSEDSVVVNRRYDSNGEDSVVVKRSKSSLPSGDTAPIVPRPVVKLYKVNESTWSDMHMQVRRS